MRSDSDRMDSPAEFRLQAEGDRKVARLTGAWTAATLGSAGRDLDAALDRAPESAIDLSGVERMDTAGAYAVIKAADGRVDLSQMHARPETLRLLEIVCETLRSRPPPRPHREGGFMALVERIGRAVVELGQDAFETLVFAGHLIAVAAMSLVNPRRIRWPACVSLAERAGLDAIPIVATASFFIGAVLGVLGADILMQFGAEVFVAEMIGIAVLREFSIVITAVLIAGRSASAFAAEIGSMKMNQEVDAMKVMGVDPFEALVFPRFFALLVTMPLLTFVANIAGLIGGMLVVWSILGLSPVFFLQRIVDYVGPSHLLVGLSKAPVMATVIAGIGCRQGMEVGGDVESLGRRVTAAVVHAIFAIIMIDAIFALIYMELDI